MRYSSDLSRKIMPHAICVILFLNMHTYRFVLPLHADKTLSQGVNNTIRIPALKKEDGENQRNSIILPLQEVRHIRFRRLSPPVKLPIKLSNEKISRARPRIVLAWRNYYFSQDFFSLGSLAYRCYTVHSPDRKVHISHSGHESWRSPRWKLGALCGKTSFRDEDPPRSSAGRA